MSEPDYDNHPCQVSYDAGVKFAKRFPNATDQQINAQANKVEDFENFRTGYFNTVNKE